MVEHNHDNEIQELFGGYIMDGYDESEMESAASAGDVQEELVELIDKLKEIGLVKWVGSTIEVTVQTGNVYKGTDTIDGEEVDFEVWTEESIDDIVIDADGGTDPGSETAELDAGTLTIEINDSETYSNEDIVAIVQDVAEDQDIDYFSVSDRDATAGSNWDGTISVSEETEAIEDAFVKLTDYDDGDNDITLTGYTDENGEIDFEELPKNEYTVTARTDYGEAEDTVTIDVDPETETVTLSVYPNAS